jgi:recombination protein RecA
MKELSPIRIAKEVLLGTLLGDGHLGLKSYRKARLQLVHSGKFINYFLWKVNRLSPLVGSFRGYFYKASRTPGLKLIGVSRSSEYLKYLWDDFYIIKGESIPLRRIRVRKILRPNVLNRLTPLSIAVWYMDDGGLRRRRRSLGRVKRGGVRISLRGYSSNEVSLVIKFFRLRYGIFFKPIEWKKTGTYSILANSESTSKFLKLVSPYIRGISDMEYKIDISKKRPSDYRVEIPRKGYDIVWSSLK